MGTMRKPFTPSHPSLMKPDRSVLLGSSLTNSRGGKATHMFKNEKPRPYSFPPNSGRLETCPVCGDDNLGIDRGVSFEGDCLRMRGKCNQCKSTWREVLTLTLVEDIRVSDKYKKRQELRDSYGRKSLERAYQMYEEGSTHLAVMQATGLDRETASGFPAGNWPSLGFRRSSQSLWQATALGASGEAGVRVDGPGGRHPVPQARCGLRSDGSGRGGRPQVVALRRALRRVDRTAIPLVLERRNRQWTSPRDSNDNGTADHFVRLSRAE